MFCHKCGFQLLDNSNFCSDCGTAVRPPAAEKLRASPAEVAEKSGATGAQETKKNTEQNAVVPKEEKASATDILAVVIGFPLVISALIFLGNSESSQKLGKLTPKNICVAAPSAELGLSRDLFSDWKTSSDEIVWLRNRNGHEYECFLSGKEVVWRAYPDGRWRHNYAQGDTEITWAVLGSTIRISRKFSDGSKRAVDYQG